MKKAKISIAKDLEELKNKDTETNNTIVLKGITYSESQGRSSEAEYSELKRLEWWKKVTSKEWKELIVQRSLRHTNAPNIRNY